MSSDITTSNHLVIPSTGEMVDITDPDAMALVATTQPEALAELLEAVDESIKIAQENRAWIAGFLIDRMDHDATQTLHAGDYTVGVNGSSDEYETYDAEELRTGLAALVAEGVLSDSGSNKAIRVKYEVSKSGLNSLRALRDDRIDSVISQASSMAIRRRRLSVKRR